MVPAWRGGWMRGIERKDAKTQRRKGKVRFFLCAFASLRLCVHSPYDRTDEILCQVCYIIPQEDFHDTRNLAPILSRGDGGSGRSGSGSLSGLGGSRGERARRR